MTRGERVIAFIDRYVVVPEGKKVGQPLRLDPFQKRFVLEVYDNPHGTRKGLLSIGRKNGKSALIAALVLAHVAGPEAVLNSQIISGAMSQKQAAIVFKSASKMVRLSPELSERVRIIPSQFSLVGLSKNVEFRAIAADGQTAQGLSPILAILDEVGQVKGETDDFVDAIVTSQGAYDAPLLIMISTQAASDSAFFSKEIDDALTLEDRQAVVHLYAADKDCDLLDEAQWRKANPSSFRSWEDIRQLAHAALRVPSKEPAFRNLILNQRVERFSPFVGRTAWKACDGPVADLEGKEVYAGLDLSSVADLTALVLTWHEGDEVHVRPYFWTPKGGLLDRAHRDRKPYGTWVDQGHLMTTPGDTIDYEFVAKFVAGLPVKWLGIGFDRWRIDQFKAALDRVEAPPEIKEAMKPVGQGTASMAPALDALERDIVDKRLRHAGHPVLTMCAANAVVEMDSAGNRKLAKNKSNGRIDGMVALAMAKFLQSSDTAEQVKYEIHVF